MIKHAAQMLVCTKKQKLHFKKCGRALHPAFVTSPQAVSVADLTLRLWLPRLLFPPCRHPERRVCGALIALSLCQPARSCPLCSFLRTGCEPGQARP